MAKRRSAPRRAAPRASGRAGTRVTLRTPAGARLRLAFRGDAFHRLTVPWNTWLVSTRLRNDIPKSERRKQARGVLGKVALAGGVSKQQLGAFLRQATKAGVVQVETEWEGFTASETDRFFPWEETLALACRDGADDRPARRLIVVRWLACPPRKRPEATGPAAILVTTDAAESPFGTDSEDKVVRRPLASDASGQPLPLRRVDSPEAIRRALRPPEGKPAAVVHWMLRAVDKGIVFDAVDRALVLEEPPPPGAHPPRPLADDRTVAEAIATHRPALVALSSCYTGRRLAPFTVAAGADLAIGFHQEVDDASLPAFFASFYEAWRGGSAPIESLRGAIDFNRDQPDHEGLGAVTLWSARDLLAPSEPPPAMPDALSPAARTAVPGPPEGLVFDCEPEPALNYSILHCSRGGLFRRFVVTALDRPPTDPLEVVASLDTGTGPPSECRFSIPAPARANSRIDLASLVALPLGGQLLRERRETLKGAVTVTVGSAGRTLLERTWSIDLLPCDEWRDDHSGNLFLPSFVLPRDPAVRTVIGRSLGFLRAIIDHPRGSFTGYPSTRRTGIESEFRPQVQAIWHALVDAFHIDYTAPPPAYVQSAQRLRTPEEVLRGHRGTCIELSLLLASCWEHIGFHPVLFLTPGHAFCGLWVSAEARERFFTSLADPMLTKGIRNPNGALGGTVVNRSSAMPWMLTEPIQHEAILEAVSAGSLLPVEATSMAFKAGLGEAMQYAKETLRNAIHGVDEKSLDAMLDVHTARERGITPLPILTDGPVA